MAEMTGCGNGGCIINPPVGQHTNAICGCLRREFKDIHTYIQVRDLLSRLHKQVREQAQKNERLEETIDEYKSASMLHTQAGDPADIEPHHIEKHITDLRAERDILAAAVKATWATMGDTARDCTMSEWCWLQDHAAAIEIAKEK